MAYLLRHTEMKFNPRKILPEAQSVIVAALNYYQPAAWKKGTHLAENGSSLGRIARYAWGRDYHKTLKQELLKLDKILKTQYPAMLSRVFVDSGPLHERVAGDGAGLGFTGKHTLLIHPDLGSWFFLGLILTDLPLEATGRVRNTKTGPRHPLGSCPSGCSRCLDICPTGALTGPMEIDAGRCISYLTIEHKGSIPLELRPLMGDWIFGCDLCQEVCPFNLKAKQTGVKDFLVHRAGSSAELAEILAIRTQEEFSLRYAGSPLMRAGRDSLVRNACVAAANCRAVELLPQLRVLADTDPSSIVREHALWAVEKLEARE